MRYALHSLRDSTELRFRTLKELWTHVRANGLCTEETDVDDIHSARRVLNPLYAIHDFDACGVVRIEPRLVPPIDG
jgi:hypothetical protein